MFWRIHMCFLFFGFLCSAYRSLSQRQILIVSVSLWGRDDTWQISDSINSLGTSCFQVSSAIGSSVLLSLCTKLQSFSLCWENFEELSVANLWYLFKVSYVLFLNCSVVLFIVIGFLSFISKINCTALPRLFFVISFRCCWAEFSRRGKAKYLDSPCV